LVGANGAGKSTLLLHLNGILTGSGRIHVNGIKVEKQNLGKIRGMVGVVFQNPDDQLFSPTVFEDVAYGLIYQGESHQSIHQKVDQALLDVGLDKDYEGRNPYHLSGGEKKRIAIATVLSMSPQILVFDEPTAGLDPRARRELIELIEKLEHTVIIATHDLDLAAKITPRMVVMNGGRIVADGNTTDLLKDIELLLANGLC
jgi:energy-coupling factor transporter ATP-binding protein EcfA2